MTLNMWVLLQTGTEYSAGSASLTLKFKEITKKGKNFTNEEIGLNSTEVQFYAC